jgi:MFS family permease
MVAIALLFRYADFVTVLGGSEWHLGWIVGVGMVGSLLVRLFLGTGIDRYGPRLVWLWSLVVFAGSCFGHVLVASHNGPAVYVLRIGFCSSIAGIFGASVTFITGRAPVARMAEMIAMLGTSGFLGIVLGTQLGDLLCGTETIERWQVDRMFWIAGTLGLGALLFAWGATRNELPPVRRRRPPLFWLLRRYHPGWVLLVGVATGVGIGLPSTFLRTYAAELGIARIGLFFGVYAPTAIITRLVTRRLPERIGLGRMIMAGLGCLIAGQLLLLIVRSEWMFVVPGIGFGMAHAILFPATIAAGSRAFPNRHRGLGTTLMMAMFDLGTLVGAPTAGAILHFSGALALPRYPTMIVSVAVMLGVVAAVYAWSRWPVWRRHPEFDHGPELENAGVPPLGGPESGDHRDLPVEDGAPTAAEAGTPTAG